MKKIFLLFGVVALISLVYISCDDEETSLGEAYKTGVVGHYGFDFSAGIADTLDWQTSQNDGETVLWNPDYYNPSPMYPSDSIYIWYRNNDIDTVNWENQYTDLGVIDITTVTSVPAAWDTTFLPCLVDHVIVAKCRDGYVKFKVLSTDASDMHWPVTVSYLFSSTGVWLD